MKQQLFLLLTFCMMASVLSSQTPGSIESDSMEAPVPMEFVVITRNPEPLNLDYVVKHLEYPKRARRRKIEGRVLLRVLVNEYGRHVEHKVLLVGHPLLLPAAEAHVDELIFQPGVSEGKPKRMWVTVPFVFKLDD